MIEISNIIRQRRTTKPSKMKAGSRVPDAVVMEALENATWAPNHGKTEPWFFVVFSGEGLVSFCKAQSELYKKESGDNFNPAKFKNLQSWSDTVSHLIAICHRRSILTKIPELEEIEAIACGVQNLALTIEAHGFAGMWSTGGITYYESAKELLGFNDHERLLGFFLVGEKMEESTPVSRRPVHEKIRWVAS